MRDRRFYSRFVEIFPFTRQRIHHGRIHGRDAALSFPSPIRSLEKLRLIESTGIQSKLMGNLRIKIKMGTTLNPLNTSPEFYFDTFPSTLAKHFSFSLASRSNNPLFAVAIKSVGIIPALKLHRPFFAFSLSPSSGGPTLPLGI